MVEDYGVLKNDIPFGFVRSNNPGGARLIAAQRWGGTAPDYVVHRREQMSNDLLGVFRAGGN